MSAVQPVNPPATRAEFVVLRDTGQLVDLAGKPIRLMDCHLCQGQHLGKEPCHTLIRCPDCHSTARHCHRPSEHEAAGWHAGRIEAMEALIDRLVAEGETRIAAPWPRAMAGQDTLF